MGMCHSEAMTQVTKVAILLFDHTEFMTRHCNDGSDVGLSWSAAATQLRDAFQSSCEDWSKGEQGWGWRVYLGGSERHGDFGVLVLHLLPPVQLHNGGGRDATAPEPFAQLQGHIPAAGTSIMIRHIGSSIYHVLQLFTACSFRPKAHVHRAGYIA